MGNLVIKGAESAEELAAANRLIAQVHFSDYHDGLDWINALGAHYPDFKREHTRVLYVDGQLAAVLRLAPHTLRIGEARLRMGGLAGVTTAAPYRKKGLAARLLPDALRYLQVHGYHVAMLFGISNFYHRWGFAATLPEYASIIDVHEAVTAPAAAFKTRDIKPGDIAAVQRMHNQHDGDTACSLLRGSGHISSRWRRWKAARVLTDSHGRIGAYFLGSGQGGDFAVEEIGLADFSWCHALLHACVETARDAYASRLRFSAPPHHPFVKYLLQYRSDHQMHVSRNSNGMMAFVNIEETLESMIPEWEARLRESPIRAERAEAVFVVDRKPYRIRAHRGLVDTSSGTGENKVSLSAQEFIQLLTGFRHVDEILGLKRRIIHPDGLRLLATMFPKRSPYVWMPDRF